MNEIIKYVALSFWLHSLRIIHLKSIHIFLFNSSSFQFIVEMYFIICIYQNLLPIQYLEGIWLGFRFSQLWIRLLKHFHAVFCTKKLQLSFGLCGRGWGQDDMGAWHWNMCIIICEMNPQSRFDAWDRVLGAGALGWPRGMGWGGRWEGDSGWGTHVHPWWIHVNVWQNQYNILK